MRFCFATFFIATALALAAPCAVQAEGITPASAVQEAAPLAADGVTPEKIELTHKLMVAMDVEKNMKARMDATMKMVGQASRNSMSNLPEQDVQDVLDMQTKLLDKYMPRLMDAMTKVYPEVYTKQELSDMLAFYESPTGQAVIKKSPLVTERSAPQMTPILMDMQADMMVQMKDLMNKRLKQSKPDADPQKAG